MGQSFFFIGSVFGVLFGVLADRIGRLPVLILANLTAMIGNLVTMLSRDLYSFSASRFLSGMATDSNFVMMYILTLEFLRPSARTLGLNLIIGIFYCLGSVITPLIALAVGEWRLFLGVTALPLLMVPFAWFVIPESIVWLVAARKPEKALKLLHRVAAVNGKAIDRAFDLKFSVAYAEYVEVLTKTKQVKDSLWGLFRTPRLRKNMLILFFKS